MITYNDLYDYLRKERYSEQLQSIPKKIISEVAEYINEKKKLISGQNEGFSDENLKVTKQMENAISIFNELMMLRKKKLLGLVFVASETGINKRDFENMLDFEKEMFDKMILAVQDSEKTVNSQLNSSGNGNNPENEMRLVLFTDDVEEFVGMGGETLGPYKKDEIVNLPKIIADILSESKKVEIVLED